jgi:hypothetical protein
MYNKDFTYQDVPRRHSTVVLERQVRARPPVAVVLFHHDPCSAQAIVHGILIEGG